jgi:hypothetical protein
MAIEHVDCTLNFQFFFDRIHSFKDLILDQISQWVCVGKNARFRVILR